MATDIPTNTVTFDLAEVARITGGRLMGGDAHVRGITTDTRAVKPGQLFVALKGESFDGHRFVAAALASAAVAAMVSDAAALPAGAAGVVVDDTLVALGALAHAHRRRWGRRVVGITGSAGKTTTKELVRGALEHAGLVVHATLGNLNNRIGVPMTLFGLDDGHDVAVIEMGTSEVGEIAKLAAIAEPDVAIVTSIGLSHAAGIGDIEDVAVEKGAMFRALGPGGIAVVNMDDPRVVAQASRLPSTLTYGTHAGAAFRVIQTLLDAEGATLTIAVPGEPEPLSVRIAIPSTVAAVNASAALAVAAALDVSLAAAAGGLASRAVSGRMAPIALESGVLVLDDTYNANPRSMVVALESAALLASQRGGRLLVVLGDMKELGSHTESAHTSIGEAVAAHSAARFVGVGSAMTDATTAAYARGTATFNQLDSSRPAEIIAALGALAPRDVILVKGSRSMRMERVVGALVTSAPAPAEATS